MVGGEGHSVPLLKALAGIMHDDTSKHAYEDSSDQTSGAPSSTSRDPEVAHHSGFLLISTLGFEYTYAGKRHWLYGSPDS